MSGLLLSEPQPGFPGHIGGIRLLKFTSDCRRFLFADLGMTVTLVSEGHEPLKFDLGSDGIKTRAMDRIHDFAFSDDGQFAFVAAGLHLRCLDLEKGIEVWRHRPANFLGFLQTSPRTVGVTKSKSVFACNDSGTMEVFRPDGRLVSRWRANDAPIMLSQMHDGHLFVGSDGIGITVWDPEDGRRIVRLRSSVRVYGIAAFPESARAAVRTDVGVCVVDLFNGETVNCFPVSPGLPYVSVSPDGKSLLVGDGRDAAHYDTDGNKIAVYESKYGRVLTALFHPKEPRVVCGTEMGEVDEIALA